MDKFKFVIAALIIVAAVGGFYYYGDQSLLFRVLGLLAAIGISTAILLQTTAGHRAWEFIGEARTEVRKVVWPTRKETVQTTLVVMAMVLVVAILLWIFDMFMMWAVKFLTGQGS